MCGIAGFSSNWPAGALPAALGALAERGPDGRYEQRVGGFALGATRLAIMDPDHGHQPFSSEDGSIVCFGAGEIYNAVELRDELTALGKRFRSRCDLEVIPHAWAHWGRKAISRLRGMFAIALWQRSDDSLHLFRDPTGQKPLYWTAREGRFGFASEMRALAAAGTELEPEPASLAAFFALRYLPGPATAFRGIEALPPGAHLEYRRGGKLELSTWDHPRPGVPGRLADLVEDCVHQASRTDAPAALYLSGGVDSRMLARAAQGAPLIEHALTLEFPGALGEAEIAAQTARQAGLQHHLVHWSDAALSRLPLLVERLENPVGDLLIVAFDLMAERTRELGVKVALSGEGPDEWFCGYGFHRAYRLASRLSRVPGALSTAAAVAPRLGGSASRLAGLGQRLGPAELHRIADWLAKFNTASPRERTDGLRRLFARDELPEILSPDLARACDTDLQRLEPLENLALRSVLLSQCQGWLPGWVSGRHEKLAMARGLEIRMPFLDTRLRDAACALTDTQRCGLLGDKRAWRKIVAASTAGAAKRPKRAFALPAIATVNGPVFRELDDAYLNPASLRQRGWVRPEGLELVRRRAHAGSLLAAKQWGALLILEIWARRFVDIRT